MSDELYYTLTEMGILSTIVPIIVALFTYHRTHHFLWWVLFLMTNLWFASDLITWYLGIHCGENTYTTIYCYRILSTLLYAILYLKLLDGFINRWFVYAGLVIYISISLSYLIYYDSWKKPVALISFMTTVYPLILCVILFFKMLVEVSVGKLTDSPLYWINSSIFFYFGVGLIAKVSHQLYYIDGSSAANLWIIVTFSSVIHNILFTIGLWKFRTS